MSPLIPIHFYYEEESEPDLTIWVNTTCYIKKVESYNRTTDQMNDITTEFMVLYFSSQAWRSDIEEKFLDAYNDYLEGQLNRKNERISLR